MDRWDSVLCRQPRQPAFVSHSPGSNDALLCLQESFQTRRADLKGEWPLAQTSISAKAAPGPCVWVSAGGDCIILGHFLAAATWQRGGGSSGLVECWFRSFQGADGWCVKPFEMSGRVGGCCLYIWGAERHWRGWRKGGTAMMLLEEKRITLLQCHQQNSVFHQMCRFIAVCPKRCSYN